MLPTRIGLLNKSCLYGMDVIFRGGGYSGNFGGDGGRGRVIDELIQEKLQGLFNCNFFV